MAKEYKKKVYPVDASNSRENAKEYLRNFREKRQQDPNYVAPMRTEKTYRASQANAYRQAVGQMGAAASNPVNRDNALYNLARQTVDDRERQQRTAFQNQAAQVLGLTGRPISSKGIQDAINRNNYNYKRAFGTGIGEGIRKNIAETRGARRNEIANIAAEKAKRQQAEQKKLAQDRIENRKDGFTQVSKTAEPIGQKSLQELTAARNLNDRKDGAVAIPKRQPNLNGYVPEENTYEQISQDPDFNLYKLKGKTSFYDPDYQAGIDRLFGASPVDYMTQEQKDTYNYIYGRYGRDAVKEYERSILPELNRMMQEDITERTYEESKNNPLKGLGLDLANAFWAPRGAFESAVNVITGQPIDTNSRAFIGTNASAAAHQGIMDRAKETFGDNIFTDVIGEGVLGMAENASRYPLGAAGLTFMGMQAASSGIKDAKDRGATDEQALAVGVTNGIVEYLTEEVSLGNLEKVTQFTENPIRTAKDFAKAVAYNFGVEASEEMASEVLDTAADLMIMQGNSQTMQRYNGYLEQGMTEQQAKLATFTDFMKDVAHSGVVGGVTGAGMAGTAGLYNLAMSQNQANNIGRQVTADMARQGMMPTENPTQMLQNLARESEQAQQGPSLSEVNRWASSERSDAENPLYERYREASEDLADSFEGEAGKEAFKKIPLSERTKAYKAFAAYYNLGYRNANISEEMKQHASQVLNAQQISEAMRAGAADAQVNYPTQEVNRVSDTAKNVKISSVKEGTVTYDKNRYQYWTSAQKLRVNYVGAMVSKVFGLDVEFFESVAGEDGRFYDRDSYLDPNRENVEAKNGAFYINQKTGRPTIALDINAGMNRASDWTGDISDIKTIFPIISHELTHYMEHYAQDHYKAISDAVTNVLMQNKNYTKGLTLNQMIQEQRRRMEATNHESYNNDDALREIVARACEDMLSGNQDAVNAFESLNKNTKKYIWNHIKKVFDNLRDFFAQMLGNYESRSAEAKAIRQNMEEFERIRGMWQEALGFAKENLAKQDAVRAENIGMGTEQAEILNEKTEGLPNVSKAKQNAMRMNINDITAEFISENRKKVANMEPVSTLKGNEFLEDTSDKRLSQRLTEFFDSVGNSAFNDATGEIILNRKTVKDDLFHGYGKAKIITTAAVPDIIEKGEVVSYEKNWKGRDYDTVGIAAPITIEGGEYKGEYYGIVVARVFPDHNRGYLHEVALTNKEWEPVLDSDRSSEKNELPSGSPSDISSILDSIRKNKKGNAISFKNGVSGDGTTLDGSGSAQFSERTYENGGREFLKMWLETQSDLSKEDRQDVVGQIDSVYDLMQKIKKEGGVEGYTAWSNVENRDGQLTVIVPNGEYPLNVDFSTVCKKRKALDHILNTMIQREDLTAAELAGKDIVRLQQIIKEEGLEIACALCFVDSKRYRIGDWADRITAGKDTGNSHQYGFNELLDSLIPEGSKLKIDEHNFTGRDIKQPKGKLLKDAPDSQLDFTLVDNLIKNSNKSSWNYKVATAIRENPEIRSYLNSAELLSSIGFDPIKAQSPAIYNLINNAGGSSKPKLSFSEVPYLNDILMNQQMKPEQAYKVGGVRIQSFSDFMANMVFDYVQMVGELQAKKLPAHAYTKESSFVALFGKTGIKINMSLVPKATTMTQEEVKDYIQKFETKKARQNAYKELKKTAGLDADGNYIWEDETFPYEVAMHFQADPEYAKNCGTIAVGISDAHIRKLLADPTIQMVIPYHSSGINNTVAKMRGIDLYTDYTKQQTTKNRATGKSITASQNTFDFYGVLEETGDPKATARAYLDWCKENNFIPKFEKFTKGPGAENYYKLLIDFRVYDENGNYAPQGAVQAIYPEPALMKEYIQDGYTYTAADGTVYHNGGLRTAQETSDKLMSKTDEIIRKYNEGKTGKKQYSSRDTEYLTAVEEDDTNKAQRMVRDAAKEIPTIAKDKRGFPLHLYHGTPDFGFTEFVDEKHKVPFIYTSTKSQVSAHYAGDNNYAFTRPIGRKYRTGNTTKDIIENAKWVLQSDLKVMTTEQKIKMYNEVREEAIKIADKLDELFPGYEVSKNWDDEVSNSISTIMDIFWTMRDADQYDFDKEESANYWKETIEQDIRWRENNLPKVKEYYENNYEKLGEEEKSFLSYLLGYEAGDVAVDIQYGAAYVATDGDVLIDSTGKKVYSPAKLKEYMDRIHEIGAYDLYGDLGDNPYEIDCEGAQFWAIKVPDMGDGYYGTDQLCKWAYEHGYTSVIMRNIYDYGDKADNYVFFDSSQLKSADPVTYDDNGDVIPLSERFNPETSDIRYSSREDDAFSLWQDVVSEKNDAAGRDSVFFLDEDDPTKVTYQQQEYFEEMSKTNDTIKAMNAALHQAIGEGKKVDVDKFAEEQAKKLRRSYGSKTAKGDLTEAIRSLCEKMNAAIQKDANDIAVVASNIGREVMQGIIVDDDTMRKQYPNLKRELKTYRILPGEKVRADMAAAYDSYEAFRRRAFGNLTIVGDDAGDFVRVDSVYQELNEKYPELFPDDIQNESEQMLRIMEVAQEVSGKKVTYTEAWGTSQDNIDEMSYMIGQDILNDYYKAAGTPAFGGVLESVRNDLTKQHKQEMKELRAKMNRQITELRKRLEETQDDLKDNLAPVKERMRSERIQALLRMQYRYEKKMEKIRERRIDADARTRLLKAAQRLARMKGGPDFEARKEALVGDLDLFAKGIGKDTQQKLEQLKTEADQLAAQDENYRLIGYEKARRAFERLSKKRIADMTGPEVAELTERIVELTYMQQATKRILDKELQIQVATAGKRVIAQQKLAKGINDRNVIGSTFGRYALNMLNPTRAMARLDGYQRDGVLTKLGKALNDGQTRQNEFTMRASKKFNTFLDAHPDLVRTWYQTDIDTGFKGEDGKPIYINKGMRISLYLHSLNYQNRNHIARAGIEIPDAKLYQKGKYAEAYRYQERLKLQPTDIKRITDGMTADEKAFANLAKEFLNVDTKDAINETSMELNGTYKATVDNYFPIRTDPNFVMGDITGLIQDGTIEGWGALKERKEGAAKPVLLEDVAVVLQRQTTNTAKYYGLAIPVRDFNKVIKWQETTGGTSVGEAINKTWGKTGTDYIRNVLRDIQTGAPGAEGPGAKLFSSLKSTYAGTVLNWNIGVSIKQSASAPFAAVVLDTKSIAKAFAPNNFFRKADLEYMDSITPWSYMRRQGMSGTEMGEVYKPKNFVQKSEKLQKFKQKTNFIQAVDVWTTNRLFLATEYYVQDHFPNLEKRGPEYNRKVAELYNDMLQRTQPSYDVMQRNAFLRSDSPMTKVFGMFKTQTFNMGGEVIDAWGRLTAFEKMHKDKQVSDAQLKKVRGQFGRTVGATIASQLMLTALGVLAKAVYSNMKNYRDDKGEVTPESTFMRAVYEFLTSFAGMTMLGSEAQSTFLALTGKEKWYDLEYPGLSTINDLITNATKMTEAFGKAVESGWEPEKVDYFRKKCIEFAMSGAILGRIPADNIYKLANALYLHYQDFIEGGPRGLLKFEAGDSLFGIRDSGVTKEQYENRAVNAYETGDIEKGDEVLKHLKASKVKEIVGAEGDKDENGKTVQNSAKYNTIDELLASDRTDEKKGELFAQMYESKALDAWTAAGGSSFDFMMGIKLENTIKNAELADDELYTFVLNTKDFTPKQKVAWLLKNKSDGTGYQMWNEAGGNDWDYIKHRSDMEKFIGKGKKEKILNYVRKQTTDEKKREALFRAAGYKDYAEYKQKH